MRLGFTGTQHCDALPQGFLDMIEDWVEKGEEFTTGACVGFDALIARHLLKVRPDARHRLIVPQNRSKVDTDLYHEFLTHTGGLTVIECLPAGSSYRDRNEAIVDNSDGVGALAQYPEDDGRSKRSGTWMTVRIGDRYCVPVRTLTLNLK